MALWERPIQAEKRASARTLRWEWSALEEEAGAGRAWGMGPERGLETLVRLCLAGPPKDFGFYHKPKM